MSREELGEAMAETATWTPSRTLPRATPGPSLRASLLAFGPPSTSASTASSTASTAPPSTATEPDDVPDDAPRAESSEATETPQATGSGGDGPRRPGPIRGRGAMVAGIVAVLALSALAGWLGGRAWGGTQSREVLDGPVAWAVVVDSRPLGGPGERTYVDVVIRVTNLGRTPITLTGAEASFDAGGIEVIAPDSVQIPAGTSIDTVAHTGIACRAPLPLRLYPLQVRTVDRALHTVDVAGAATALARACEAQGPATRILTLVSVTEDGDRLRLTIKSPTGRTTEIQSLRAQGVSLTGRPLYGSFDARDRTVWVDRPPTCPAAWLSGGLPRTITMDVDVGGPTTVTFDTGYAMARWLRAGPCAGSRR